MKRIVLSPQAVRDLEEITNFLFDKAGATVALRIEAEIRNAVKLIGERPGIGHTRTDLTHRPVLFWPLRSYFVVYNPRAKPIRILRILHGSRNIPRLLH